MDILQAIILGIVQGLTEFLPVSSSGHLELAHVILGVELEENLTLTLLLHLGTVCSTLCVLYKEVWALGRGFFRFKDSPEMRYVLLLLISLIPIAIVGFFFEEQVENMFTGNLALVGSMLLLTALLLSFTHLFQPQKAGSPTIKSSLLMGIGQALAVLPGLSRSGTTISLGLLAGVNKNQAASFSFFMVIPPILGKFILDFFSDAPLLHSTLDATVLISGFLASFITGYFACRWMLSLVRKAKLYYFSIYCALVGIIALIFAFV